MGIATLMSGKEATVASWSRRIGILCLGVFIAATMSGGAVGAQQTRAGAVTYHRDVVPILQKNCQSCHRPGQIGPMPLLTYQQTRPWAVASKAKVASRQMPPWLAAPRYGHFSNDTSLPSHDIETLAAWADQ